METNQQTNQALTLPVLKPITIEKEFLDKIKGDSLKSNIIMLIAEESDYVFFLACCNENETSNIDPEDIVKLNTQKGILDNGQDAKITLADSIDLSTIYKINYFDLRKKVSISEKELPNYPYLGIEDQISVVNKLSTKLKSATNMPRLVLIKKSLNNQETKVNSCTT